MDLNNNLAAMIKLTSDLVEKLANNELSRYNITLSQARILLILYHSKAESLSFKAMEKLFSVSQATMQGTISRMAKKGLVKTECLANDKKTKYVSITNEGKLLVSSFSKSIAEVNRLLTKDLSEAEFDELKHILTKVHASVKHNQ